MNKLISLIYPVAVIGLMFFTSCEDNLKSKELNPDYFPLQVGNYWKFNFIGTKTVDQTIDQTVTLDGKEYFRMISIYPGTTNDTTYYRKSSDGKVYSRKLKTEESLLYDFKAAVDDSWHNGTMAVTLKKTDEQKVLGSLTIKNCYLFYCDPKASMADDEYKIWLAPGIGCVDRFALGGAYNQNNVLLKAKINGVETTYE